MQSEPTTSHLMFCDQVIVEQGTGRNSLINTFDNLALPNFPAKIPRIMIHVGITNFLPTGNAFKFAINLKRNDSGATISSFGHDIPLPKPPGTPNPSDFQINLNVPLMNITFPAAGLYLCEILFEGDVIGSKPLRVIHKPLHPNHPPQVR